MKRRRMLKLTHALIAATFFLFAFQQGLFAHPQHLTLEKVKHSRKHLDHSGYFKKEFKSGREVTKACLKCHKETSKDFMKTRHWQWLGEPVKMDGKKKPVRLGKKNLINNFCISIQGNWPSCTKCHAGYGWKDDSFDFSKEENVDCLVCHDWSKGYSKTKAGLPSEDTNLLEAAKSVGYPKRDNCGSCHNFGGGGLGVKHGDLDNSLDNPTPDDDVHMGRHDMLCIDCHGGDDHVIYGHAYSVSVKERRGVSCTMCHKDKPHKDAQLNNHMDAVACQSCHIPNYARRIPTKMTWDWSKAGDAKRKDDPHSYLKIKGEFTYEQSVIPEYAWFNKSVDRYLAGDKIDPTKPIPLNAPKGGIKDKSAKIWPFKVHRAKQPFDKKNKHLLVPVTAGEGGFWHEFNWPKAFKLGEKVTGLAFSGEYDFAETLMYWPISHMVVPKEKALGCTDCHGKNQKRMDWQALGYSADPMKIGGRE